MLKSKTSLLKLLVVNFLILFNYLSLSSAFNLKDTFFGDLKELYPEEGEEVEVEFLSQLSNPQELWGRVYHVVQVTLRGTLLDIHLLRMDTYQEDYLDRDYSQFQGEIKPGRGSIAVTVSEQGFSGHLVHENEHFIIEPLGDTGSVLKRRRRKRSTGKKRTMTSIPHKIYNVERIRKMRDDNQTHTDVAHVPLDELEKAIKEMKNASDSLTSTTTPSSREGDDEEQVLGQESEGDEQVVEIFASNTKIKKGDKAKKKQKPNPSKSSSPTVPKMSISGQKVVDIAIFADSKLYQAWETRYPQDAKTKLKMHVLYQQSSLGVSISFRIVHLEMMSSVPSGLDSSGGEATKYLKSFCKYAGDKNEKGGQWDHALLLTGYDLKEGRDSLVAGMAWFSTMCLREVCSMLWCEKPVSGKSKVATQAHPALEGSSCGKGKHCRYGKCVKSSSASG